MLEELAHPLAQARLVAHAELEQHHFEVSTEAAMNHQLYLESLIPEDPASTENPSSLEVTHFPSVVGRAPECDYRIANPLISRRHCCFFEQDDHICIRDLGSRNGTHLNGQPLSSEMVVHEGDRLDIGYLPYRVHLSKRSRLERFLENIATGKTAL